VLIAVRGLLLVLFKRKWLIDKISKFRSDAYIIVTACTFILSLIAFLISTYIIYCECCGKDRCCNSDSIVVAAFGILVTLLVGWQIYKTVDVDRRIDERIKKQDTKIENNAKDVEIKTKELEKDYNIKFGKAYHSITNIHYQTFINNKQWENAAQFWCLLIENPYGKYLDWDKQKADGFVEKLIRVLGEKEKHISEIEEKTENRIIRNLEVLKEFSHKAEELQNDLKTHNPGKPIPS
jgi:hypothetical protein